MRGGRAIIVVSDSGVGISPDFLPHVFERFRQASSGDSRTYTGLGLGLSIVQHLVQLHGGRVGAESEGGGTLYCDAADRGVAAFTCVAGPPCDATGALLDGTAIVVACGATFVVVTDTASPPNPPALPLDAEYAVTPAVSVRVPEAGAHVEPQLGGLFPPPCTNGEALSW